MDGERRRENTLIVPHHLQPAGADFDGDPARDSAAHHHPLRTLRRGGDEEKRGEKEEEEEEM